jgi:hypothetical protein
MTAPAVAPALRRRDADGADAEIAAPVGAQPRIMWHRATTTGRCGAPAAWNDRGHCRPQDRLVRPQRANRTYVEPRGLEPRHPPCKGGALPSELWPLVVWWTFHHDIRPAHLGVGLDPATSRLQGGRSTRSATSPRRRCRPPLMLFAAAYPERDSNAHCRRPGRRASCQLGYPGPSRHISLGSSCHACPRRDSNAHDRRPQRRASASWATTAGRGAGTRGGEPPR